MKQDRNSGVVLTRQYRLFQWGGMMLWFLFYLMSRCWNPSNHPVCTFWSSCMKFVKAFSGFFLFWICVLFVCYMLLWSLFSTYSSYLNSIWKLTTRFSSTDDCKPNLHRHNLSCFNIASFSQYFELLILLSGPLQGQCWKCVTVWFSLQGWIKLKYFK